MTEAAGGSAFLNYGRILRLSAMRYRDQPALEFQGTVTTFGALNRQVNAMAHALAARGVGAGDRVVVCAENGADYVRVLFAVAKLGAVSVPTNTALLEADLAFVFEATQPRLVAASARHLDRARAGLRLAALDHKPAVVRLLADGAVDAPESGADILDWSEHSTEEPADPGVSDSSPAVMLFTSGSMGTPKAVEKSFANITWHALNRQVSQPRREGARELFVLPLTGVGFANFLLTDIMVGATCVLEPVFDATRTAQRLSDGDIEFVFLAPTMMMAIEAAAPRSAFPTVRVLETAYEVTMPHRQRIAAMFPSATILYSYGCTEGSMARAPAEAFLTEPSNVGFASGLDEYRVVARAVEDLGEIEVSGPTVMRGYLTRPGQPPSDDVRDGWFPTGDLGWVDGAGALHFGGRAKDMIKTGAVNVFAWEVEAALAAHEGVAGVAVIGVPDEYWGEAVVAVVQPRAGVALSEADLRQHAEVNLAGFRRPKVYYVVDRLPLNAGGKVAKGEVRKLVASDNARRLGVPAGG